MPGTIDQIPSGKFRLRMYVSGVQRTVGFYETREAAGVAAEAYALALAETAPEYEGLTLAKLGKSVLTTREVLKQVRDPDSDWSRWNTHVKNDPIAIIPLRRLNADDLKEWLRRLEKKRLSPSTRRNCLNLVRVILAEAPAKQMRTNPALGVRVKGRSPDAWTYLNLTEQMAILNALGDHAHEWHLVAFAMGTGLRAGELVSLRLEDVHLDSRPRVVVRYGSPPKKPTKTGALRTVFLFGMSLQAVRSWLTILPMFCPQNTKGLLFPRERGGYRSKDHVILWGSWKAALERAGIQRRFRWHDLRHTCASSLVSGWWGRRWSLQEVKEMLGHTSITITQRYAHLAESALELAAAATSGKSPQVMGGAPETTRTSGLPLRKRLLYPAELRGQTDEKSDELGIRRLSTDGAGSGESDLGETHGGEHERPDQANARRHGVAGEHRRDPGVRDRGLGGRGDTESGEPAGRLREGAHGDDREIRRHADRSDGRGSAQPADRGAPGGGRAGSLPADVAPSLFCSPLVEQYARGLMGGGR